MQAITTISTAVYAGCSPIRTGSRAYFDMLCALSRPDEEAKLRAIEGGQHPPLKLAGE
jgi:hypothetical protein